MAQKLLKLRRRMKKRKPEFLRQEYFKHKKLEKKWRKPKGAGSKLRQGEKPRGKMPSTGYSSPRKVRGLSRLGLKEIRVFNPNDILKFSKEKDASFVIASAVGKKKRGEIIKKAGELGLKISNV